jgi:xanthine dehydrogenase iron-sulfur cluster and FAD-binding subunit A
MAEATLTASALRRKAEQQERDTEIIEALNAIHARGRLAIAHTPDALVVPNFLWDLQYVIGDLCKRGLLTRNDDIGCVRAWLTQIADEMAQIAQEAQG